MIVGFIGAGEMGAGMAAAMVRAGHACLAVGEGRSAETVGRMNEAGMESVPSLDDLASRSEIAFSVVPPERAEDLAAAFARCATGAGRETVFVEANAISPDRSRRIAAAFAGTPVRPVDGGIVGMPPEGRARPRLYVSGPASGRLDGLDGTAFDLVRLGPEIGAASALKMTYAALTKGTNTLLTNVLLAAERLGLSGPLSGELQSSQGDLLERGRRIIPRLPSDAGRWVFEMREIADTFRSVGLPGEFHDGAAAIMKLLAESEFGGETRRTRDRSRSMERTVEALAGRSG